MKRTARPAPLLLVAAAAALTLAAAGPAALAAADAYKVDPVHSVAVFRVKHANASFFWGRFNSVAGEYALDESDVTKSTFSVEIAADSVDTNNDKRDAHLKSPDFFNAQQFPKITFKSTAAAKGEGANVLQVTGDLTLHGVTKSITVPVELTGKGEFPPGAKRAGVEATIVVKMSDFAIKGIPGAVGDEVRVIVGLSGVKQ